MVPASASISVGLALAMSKRTFPTSLGARANSEGPSLQKRKPSRAPTSLMLWLYRARPALETWST
jgi:hypothetical protein